MTDKFERHSRGHKMVQTLSLPQQITLSILASICLLHFASAEPAGLRVTVSYSEQPGIEKLDGRILLLISNQKAGEPRFEIRDDYKSQQVFGLDVEELGAGEAVVFDGGAFGYPLQDISSIPAGEYRVQALFHRYETFHRSDGHVVKLPMDRGEGQQWNKAPGNLFSEPQNVYLDPNSREALHIVMDREIPPIEPPRDTRYVRHVTMQSKLLSEFWGRPMYLGAVLLLPEGFDERAGARYPLIINHGHFPHTFTEFREEAADTTLEGEYSERFDIEGYNLIQQQYAHRFYRDWTGPGFPRWIIMKIQHANPYYDDSYAVNSQNLGPYGDAITYELIPFIEEKFRCIGEPWSRFLYGGSTGGWEALAAQVFYPKAYNGCFAACPDPVDFRAYTITNIYEHENAYRSTGPWGEILRPGKRNLLGELSSTLRDQNYYELALGTRGRSGQQWDIWQAVYSPVGKDGYPRPIWDKRGGEIDREVAEHWRQNYDLSYILQRDWPRIGQDLQGKIHIYCGDMDNYYLNNAVYYIEAVLENTRDPYYNGVIEYGDRAEHCWNGDHALPNALSRLRYHQMYVEEILERIRASAPADADTTSWRY